MNRLGILNREVDYICAMHVKHDVVLESRTRESSKTSCTSYYYYYYPRPPTYDHFHSLVDKGELLMARCHSICTRRRSVSISTREPFHLKPAKTKTNFELFAPLNALSLSSLFI